MQKASFISNKQPANLTNCFTRGCEMLILKLISKEKYLHNGMLKIKYVIKCQIFYKTDLKLHISRGRLTLFCHLYVHP